MAVLATRHLRLASTTGSGMCVHRLLLKGRDHLRRFVVVILPGPLLTAKLGCRHSSYLDYTYYYYY